MNDSSARGGLSPTRGVGIGGGVVLAALCVSCAGDVASPPSSQGAAGDGSSGVVPSPGGTGGAGANPTLPAAGSTNVAGATNTPPNSLPPVSVPPSSEVCRTSEISRTPLRRLTRFEYANSVRHLLHVDLDVARDLPVDEVTDGFNNNAAVLTVSALHAEKYVLASEALAKEAVTNPSTSMSCDVLAKGEEACASELARSFGRRAFRRPTTAQDEQLLLAAYAVGKTGGSHAEGIEVMIRAALQSPHFLYRLELSTPADATARLVPLSQYELATRLSYLLWASGPDDALLDLAEQGGLATAEQVAAKARAMLEDPKARAAVADFYSQWLGTTRLEVTNKNTALFPAYSNALREAMAQELPAFIEYVHWTSDHSFDTLLTSPLAFVSGPLAELYGVTAPGGAASSPQNVMLPPEQGRSGILTQAAFLSVQAHPDQTSPVLRGKFIRTKLLCQPPPPPPPDADISPPEIDQGGTARERFSAHLTAGNSCSGCHVLMDPIGLAFEHFDAVGRYRPLDGGRSIDASGEVLGADDASLAGPFNGVRELAAKLSGSDQVRDCAATQWFRFAAGRSEEQADSCSLARLQEAFAASNGDLIELLVGVTQTDSFRFKSPLTQ